MLIAAARGPLTRRKTAGASSASPTFHQFALEFSDIGGASKTVTMSGVAGDLWIGFVQMTDNKTINNPSGWSSPIVDISHAGSVNFKVKVWWRVLTEATSNPTFAINSAGDEWACGVIGFKGANATAPIDVVATDNDDQGRSPICPSATTLGANRLCLRLFGGGNHVTTQDANYPGSTTGLFARDLLSAENSQCVGAACHTQASAGATGTAQFNNVMAASGRLLAVTIGIKP
jgi:hypothetical protein